MNCREFAENMTALFDREPDPALRKELERHMEECEDCAERCRQWRETLGALWPRHTVSASEGFTRRVLEAAGADREPRGAFSALALRRWSFPARIAAGVAAMLLIAISYALFGPLFERGHVPENGQTPFTLLSEAIAAQESLLFDEGTTHLVRRVTVTPVKDPRLANVRWESINSIRPDGEIQFNRLMLGAEPGQQYSVKDEVWHEPETGRFVRLVSAGETVVFANSWDGGQVRCKPSLPEYSLPFNGTEERDSLALPEKLLQALGFVTDYDTLLESFGSGDRITELDTEVIFDGSTARVFSLEGMPDPSGKVRSRFLFKIREKDRILGEVVFIADEEVLETVQYEQPEKTGEPPVRWDLRGVDVRGYGEEGYSGVHMELDVMRTEVPLKAMFARADLPLAVFDSPLSWTGEGHNNYFKLFGENNDWYFMQVFPADDGRHVVLSQCQFFQGFYRFRSRFEPVCSSGRGFTLYRTPQGKWLANNGIASSKGVHGDEPSGDREGYMLQTPAGTLASLAVNGRLTGEELQELVEKLVLEEEYVTSHYESPPAWARLFLAFLQAGADSLRRLAAIDTMPEPANPRTGLTPLMVAVHRGLAERAAIMIRAGADVNRMRSDHHTPLMIAVQSGSRPVLELLLHNGADPEIAGLQDRTPLFVALDYADTSAARILLEHGAKTDRRVFGRTPLMMAAYHGNAAMIRILATHGADVDDRRVNGQTALTIAVQGGKAEATAALILAGADVNIPDRDDKTPLMYAAVQGSVAIIGMLIEAGADLEAQNVNGYTALMHAAEAGGLEAVETLLAAGADPGAVNNEGLTAMQLAEKKGYQEIVRLIESAAAVL